MERRRLDNPSPVDHISNWPHCIWIHSLLTVGADALHLDDAACLVQLADNCGVRGLENLNHCCRCVWLVAGVHQRAAGQPSQVDVVRRVLREWSGVNLHHHGIKYCTRRPTHCLHYSIHRLQLSVHLVFITYIYSKCHDGYVTQVQLNNI